jgi:trimeric autotransporter adhesin
MYLQTSKTLSNTNNSINDSINNTNGGLICAANSTTTKMHISNGCSTTLSSTTTIISNTNGTSNSMISAQNKSLNSSGFPSATLVPTSKIQLPIEIVYKSNTSSTSSAQAVDINNASNVKNTVNFRIKSTGSSSSNSPATTVNTPTPTSSMLNRFILNKNHLNSLIDHKNSSAMFRQKSPAASSAIQSTAGTSSGTVSTNNLTPGINSSVEPLNLLSESQQQKLERNYSYIEAMKDDKFSEQVGSILNHNNSHFKSNALCMLHNNITQLKSLKTVSADANELNGTVQLVTNQKIEATIKTIENNQTNMKRKRQINITVNESSLPIFTNSSNSSCIASSKSNSTSSSSSSSASTSSSSATHSASSNSSASSSSKASNYLTANGTNSKKSIKNGEPGLNTNLSNNCDSLIKNQKENGDPSSSSNSLSNGLANNLSKSQSQSSLLNIFKSTFSPFAIRRWRSKSRDKISSISSNSHSNTNKQHLDLIEKNNKNVRQNFLQTLNKEFDLNGHDIEIDANLTPQHKTPINTTKLKKKSKKSVRLQENEPNKLESTSTKPLASSSLQVEVSYTRTNNLSNDVLPQEASQKNFDDQKSNSGTATIGSTPKVIFSSNSTNICNDAANEQQRKHIATPSALSSHQNQMVSQSQSTQPPNSERQLSYLKLTCLLNGYDSFDSNIKPTTQINTSNFKNQNLEDCRSSLLRINKQYRNVNASETLNRNECAINHESNHINELSSKEKSKINYSSSFQSQLQNREQHQHRYVAQQNNSKELTNSLVKLSLASASTSSSDRDGINGIRSVAMQSSDKINKNLKPTTSNLNGMVSSANEYSIKNAKRANGETYVDRDDASSSKAHNIVATAATTAPAFANNNNNNKNNNSSSNNNNSNKVYANKSKYNELNDDIASTKLSSIKKEVVSVKPVNEPGSGSDRLLSNGNVELLTNCLPSSGNHDHNYIINENSEQQSINNKNEINNNKHIDESCSGGDLVELNSTSSNNQTQALIINTNSINDDKSPNTTIAFNITTHSASAIPFVNTSASTSTISTTKNKVTSNEQTEQTEEIEIVNAIDRKNADRIDSVGNNENSDFQKLKQQVSHSSIDKLEENSKKDSSSTNTEKNEKMKLKDKIVESEAIKANNANKIDDNLKKTVTTFISTKISGDSHQLKVNN